MVEKLKISVVIATYNGQKFLLEQLNSIKNQSREPNEVIIQDDNSTDGTAEMISNYIKTNNLTNWKLIINNHNMGWRKNFISVLQKATGDIIFLSDQDDIWYSTKIDLMTKEFEKNDNIKVLSSDYEEMIHDGGRSFPLQKYSYIKEYDSDHILFRKKNSFQLRPGNTYAVRKSFISPIVDFFYLNPNVPHDSSIQYVAYLYDGLYNYPFKVGIWRKWGGSSFEREYTTKKTKAYKSKLIDATNYYQGYLDRYSSMKNYINEKKVIKLDSNEYKLIENNICKFERIIEEFRGPKVINFKIKLTDLPIRVFLGMVKNKIMIYYYDNNEANND